MIKESFIIGTFRVPKAIFDYIYTKLLKGYRKEQIEFFCHILYNTIRNLKKDSDGYVPVPKSTIYDVWKKRMNPQPLIDSGLLELKIDEYGNTHSYKNKRCKEYRVPLDIVENIMNLYPERYTKDDIWDLMKGRKTLMRDKPTKRSEIRSYYRKYILRVLDLYLGKKCIVNLDAIVDYLKLRKQEINTEKDRRSYLNDLFCYHNILCSLPTKIENELYEYDLIYDPQSTGRISERHGKLQSCSRRMKKAAFSNIENLRNYDLRSSQVYILEYYFNLAGIESKWIKNYFKTNKQTIADELILNIDTFKSCLMAVIFGSDLIEPEKLTKKLISNNSILKYIDEYTDDFDVTFELYKNFYDYMLPLKNDIKLLKRWFWEVYIPNNTYDYETGGLLVRNSCDMLVPLEDIKGIGMDKFLIFMLQGKEAHFIHQLTYELHRTKVKVISNQHDGLVTIGEIPLDAIKYAKDTTGLEKAEMTIKDFL